MIWGIMTVLVSYAIMHNAQVKTPRAQSLLLGVLVKEMLLVDTSLDDEVVQ